jgi:hypothetical protein
VSFNDGTEEKNEHKKIAAQCYQYAPARVRRIIARLVERDTSGFAIRNAAGLIEDFFDEQLGSTFLRALDSSKDEERDRAIVSFLASKEYQPITSAITEFLKSGPDSSQFLSRQQLIVGVSALLDVRPRRWWPLVDKLLSSNAELARDILLKVAGGRSIAGEPFTAALSENDAADFLLWAYSKIPQREETEGGYLNELDHMDYLRNAALRDLVGRGTSEAVVALASSFRQ